MSFPRSAWTALATEVAPYSKLTVAARVGASADDDHAVQKRQAALPGPEDEFQVIALSSVGDLLCPLPFPVHRHAVALALLLPPEHPDLRPVGLLVQRASW